MKRNNKAKSVMFKNRFTDDRFICDDLRRIDIIEGVEYLFVRRAESGDQRVFKMRKDALEKVKQ